MIVSAFAVSAIPAWAMDKGPSVGSFAPELGERQWLQKDKSIPVEISKLRGKVVLIQTFAYYCDP
jgi:hypothetical protein